MSDVEAIVTGVITVAGLIFYGWCLKYGGCDCPRDSTLDILRENRRASEWRQGDRDE